MEYPQTKERIYWAILRYWARYKIPPTLREICCLAQVSSTSVVAYNLAMLEKENRIEVTPGKVRCIRLVGATWSPLEPVDILKIGLVPPVPVERVRSIGNAAGDGARMALFNRGHRRRATQLAKRLRVLELSLRTDFQDLFVAHTVLAPEAPVFEAA